MRQWVMNLISYLKIIIHTFIPLFGLNTEIYSVNLCIKSKFQKTRIRKKLIKKERIMKRVGRYFEKKCLIQGKVVKRGKADEFSKFTSCYIKRSIINV